MTNYIKNKSRRVSGSRKSGGGTAVQVLTFLGVAVIIVGAVIAYEKRGKTRTPDRAEPGTAKSVGTAYTEEYYINRGLKPNTSTPRPKDPVTDPTTVTPSSSGREAATTTTTPDYRYVGRSDWNRYHRLNCKYAQKMLPEKKVFFKSAGEAISKGYVPCKICKPPMSAGGDTGSGKSTPSPVKHTEKPVYLPVKDVSVPFPFNIVAREVVTERGVIRVEFTVDVEKPIQRDDVLRLARKIVAGEIRKRKINSVSIFMRTKVNSRKSLKWVCMVDWAPYGDLVRANEVTTGDYRTHQFNIFDQGVFRR